MIYPKDVIDACCGRPKTPCDFVHSSIKSLEIDLISLNSNAYLIDTTANVDIERLFLNKYVFCFSEIQLTDWMISDTILSPVINNVAEKVSSDKVRKKLLDSIGEMKKYIDQDKKDSILNKSCYLLLYKGEPESYNLIDVYVARPSDVEKYFNSIIK